MRLAAAVALLLAWAVLDPKPPRALAGASGPGPSVLGATGRHATTAPIAAPRPASTLQIAP